MQRKKSRALISPKRRSMGFALPLFFKIFLTITTVVALALLAAILVTSRQGNVAAKAQVDRDLAQITAAQKSIEGAVFREIETKTSFVSSDPNVARYFESASGDDLGLSNDDLGIADEPADELGLDASDAAPASDSSANNNGATLDTEGQSSIKDLLSERRATLDVSMGLVMDSQGQVLARDPQEGEPVEESLSKDAFVAAALNANGEGRSGYWRDGDKLYLAAIGPIVSGDSLVGFVLLGNLVEKSTAEAISKISGAQAALFVMDSNNLRLIGSSLNADAGKALEAAVGVKGQEMTTAMNSDKRVDLKLAGADYEGQLTTLYGENKSPVGALLGLTPTEQSKSAFNAIQRAVNLTGLGMLLLAGLASWFLTRGLLKPVRQLADLAERASGGEYDLHVDVKGNDEIGKLGHAFDALLSSLREKGDMEGYVSNLSKFLPEPREESAGFASRAPQIAPQRYAMTLIAIDFRRFASDVAVGQEAITMTQLATLHSDAQSLAAQFDGKLLEQASARVLLGFGGEHRQLRALHVLAILLTRSAALGAGAAPSAAVHDGELVFGSLPNFDGTTGAFGLAPAQIARLLGEAGPGQILLGPGFAKAIGTQLGREPGLAVGANSGKRFYALTPADLASLPALEEPAPDPNATRVADGNETRIVSGPVNEANAQRLAPGMRLGGRYEIQGVLGAGGMGVVYKARDLDLDDVVALKMLRGAALMDPEHLDRLKSELKLARKITHPSVLRTHDFGDVNGQPFISMEYVRGMTLRYLIQHSGKLPFSAGLRIAKQIAAGLEAAHAVGVLHRDIKPENVILEANGNAKLMDFGIARPIRRTAPGHTQPGMFVGTPNYSPPEALAGEEVDARGDVYSMGVMLCEMFCGQLPFEAGSTMEMYMAHSQQAPILPSKLWPDIPKTLELIILKCLEKAPTARFASAEALFDALNSLRS